MKPIIINLNGLVKPKKNSKRIIRPKCGRPILLPSEAFVEWYSMAMAQLMIGEYPRDQISEPIQVKIQFFIKDKRRRDLTNLAESVMDLLVDYGTIADDRWQICRYISMVGFGSDEDRVNITIEYIN